MNNDDLIFSFYCLSNKLAAEELIIYTNITYLEAINKEPKVHSH
jgi:hypothetical protein